MKAMPKFVVSMTLENPEWNNTSVVRGYLVGVGRPADAAVRQRQ